VTARMPRAERAAGYPWPFTGPSYRYAVNVEPTPRRTHTAAGSWGATVLDVDGDHHADLAERRRILTQDPRRCAVLDHMVPATWDAMLLLMRELVAARPHQASLVREVDGSWRWRNALAGVDQRFTYGEPASLPVEPLRFIGEQLQEDLVLLDQREGALWLDAGLVTFAAGWSLAFDLGMSLREVHSPVPRLHAEGIIARAEQLLLRLRPGEPYRRTNWSLAPDGRLDASLEALAGQVDGPPDDVHLRVEVQHLLRLPASGAVLFTIRTYLMPLDEVAAVPGWGGQLAAVLDDLPADVAAYKGIPPLMPAARALLSASAPAAAPSPTVTA